MHYRSLNSKLKEGFGPFTEKNYVSTYVVPGADAELILGCCKILLKKPITIRCVKSKGFYRRLFWPKLHRNRDIMALAWVAKLTEQRAIFKNLLSFCLYSLLHGIIKTFLKSFTRLVLCNTNIILSLVIWKI